MKNMKKWLALPTTTIILFMLAVILLLGSSYAGARAALTYYSETYASQVQMHDIGVTLIENERKIAYRDYIYSRADGSWDKNTQDPVDAVLLDEMLLETGDVLLLGRAYQERLAVMNSGTINEYVRVNVYRYWVHLEEEWLTPELIAIVKKEMKEDVDANKHISAENRTLIKEAIDKKEITITNINVYRFLRAYNTLHHTNKTLDDFKIRTILPSAIDLHFVNLVGQDGEECWLEDKTAQTEERNVFYYTRLLSSGSEGLGEITPLLSDTLTIDSFPAGKTQIINQENGTYILYGADGNFFVLDVTVDAVQDHNAKSAILSAWGMDVDIDKNGELRFSQLQIEDEAESVQDEAQKEEVQDEENQ